MRGYFALGVEGADKPVNLGNLMRTAHAFGASFSFTVGVRHPVTNARSDTSRSVRQVPTYHWPTVDEMALPHGCQLVGVEILDDAVDLPSFRHPSRAAYVLGPERGALSAAILERCVHVVRIPTAFSINLATAGAIVMYDRVRTLGRFAPRPVHAGAPDEAIEPHRHGRARIRRGEDRNRP